MDTAKLLVVSLSLALLLGLVSSLEIHDRDLESEESLWDLYGRWRSEHTVSRGLREIHQRFNVFKHNVNYIHEFNKQDKPYKLRLNRFATMTSQEFRSWYAGSKVNHYRALHGTRRDTGFMYQNVTEVPPSVDWRKEGAVTAVKYQGQFCNSCWAFSTIAAVEGINKLRNNKLVSLSEQELVDCDQGCNGGLMELAFEFIEKNRGITTEQNYPYKGKHMLCNTNKVNSLVVTIDGHENVPANDENALLKAVANQPVSVVIDTNFSNLQFYSEGVVVPGDCGTKPDHGVAIVGYGTTVDGTKYWIVKNSWGADWGEKGYVRMERDISAKEGTCGIATDPSYPIKTSANPTSSRDEL